MWLALKLRPVEVWDIKKTRNFHQSTYNMCCSILRSNSKETSLGHSYKLLTNVRNHTNGKPSIRPLPLRYITRYVSMFDWIFIRSKGSNEINI